MNLQVLQSFSVVAEYGSFSRAAVVLGINQSALSRHIRMLEDDLGAPLFYRHGRGVILTEHGHRFLERAVRVLEEIDLAKQEALHAKGSTIGAVTIGVTPTVARMLVVPLSKHLMAAYPGIQIRFSEGFSGHLLEWLDQGRIDIAILYKNWAAGRINAQHLMDEKLCLVGSKRARRFDATTPFKQLADLPLILPSPPHGLRRLIDLAAADQQLSLNVVIEADSFSSILALVMSDIGYSVLPLAAMQDELQRADLHASVLCEPEVLRTIVLATPKNRPLAAGTGDIITFIKGALKPMGS